MMRASVCSGAVRSSADRLQKLEVGWENREQPELVAVCEERGIRRRVMRHE